MDRINIVIKLYSTKGESKVDYDEVAASLCAIELDELPGRFIGPFFDANYNEVSFTNPEPGQFNAILDPALTITCSIDSTTDSLKEHDATRLLKHRRNDKWFISRIFINSTEFHDKYEAIDFMKYLAEHNNDNIAKEG